MQTENILCLRPSAAAVFLSFTSQFLLICRALKPLHLLFLPTDKSDILQKLILGVDF